MSGTTNKVLLPESVSSASRAATDRLPVAGLLALAMTGFVAIMTETLPAGLFPQIGRDLHTSGSLTGQLVTAYAVGSLLASIPLTTATRGWHRRPVLLLSIISFLIFNTCTAASSVYTLTLAARFLAGATAGLAWGIIAGYARLMVTDRQKGQAVAIAMAGTPIALSLGLPAGTFLSRVMGWRSIFMLMSGMSVLLIGWVLWKVPDFPGQKVEERLSVQEVLVNPGVRPVLAVVFFWMVSHNILYTYISPFVAAAGVRQQVGLVLLIFGMSAIAGIWIIGLIVDRMLRWLTLASLIAFALCSLALSVGGKSPFVLYPAVVVWGLTFGGAATLLQTACANAAGTGADIAPSLVTTAWNAAIAVGGVAGGLLLSHFGASTFPWAMALLVSIAIGIAWRSGKHGFDSTP